MKFNYLPNLRENFKTDLVTNIKKLTNDYFKDLIVISYNEIDSNIELKSVGVVTIDDN